MRNIEEEGLHEECCLWKIVLPQVSIPLYIVMAACTALRLDCQVTVYCSVQNPAGGGGMKAQVLVIQIVLRKSYGRRKGDMSST
jgi:hypothetical protein